VIFVYIEAIMYLNLFAIMCLMQTRQRMELQVLSASVDIDGEYVKPTTTLRSISISLKIVKKKS